MIMPGIGQALATIIYISGNTKNISKSKTKFQSQKTCKVFCKVWFKKYRSLKKSDLKQNLCFNYAKVHKKSNNLS